MPIWISSERLVPPICDEVAKEAILELALYAQTDSLTPAIVMQQILMVRQHSAEDERGRLFLRGLKKEATIATIAELNHFIDRVGM